MNLFLLSSLHRHYRVDVELPCPLQPDAIAHMRRLRACVIRSLFYLYKPFNLRISKIPALPESTPTTLLNSKVNEMSFGPCGFDKNSVRFEHLTMFS